MSSPLDSPVVPVCDIHRVAIVFAGGPAPAANAVISTAAASFLKGKIEVLGIRYGYSNLIKFGPERPLAEGEHYLKLDSRALKRTRNSQGILIGTSRANPGKKVSHPDHLSDPEKCAPLQAVYDGLCSLQVDALISIGGDDTLKTANKLKMFQDRLPEGAKRIPVVHVPKTIDNDYHGIDFTFGYFTAVDTLAAELRNLLHDAEASNAYFLAETMGRSAGWLAYGAAIAGESSLVVSVEDIADQYLATETYVDHRDGKTKTRQTMVLDKVVDRIVRTIRARDAAGKRFGVIVLAEGLAELLPWEMLKDVPRDDHDHISISHVNLGRTFSRLVSKAYEKATGMERKVTGVQLGYEVRCARPHAFDVMLGSQLGVGAYRALVEKRLNGVMISTEGQLQLRYERFEDLIDPETLVTKVRYVDREGDFHYLARFLETEVAV